MVELDGSFGEGGGQILRTSLALSLMTGRPFHLRHIRAGRSRPGLQPQHLMSVQAAASVGRAPVRGAGRGSTDLEFQPGSVMPGKYHFPIGTAGATSLVLHTIFLPLALAGSESEITIEGGTHVASSPCYHFLATTWNGYMAQLGLKLALNMRRPGFYPRGGGLLKADILPCARLVGLGDFHVMPATTVTGFSAAAGLPEHVAHRQAQRAGERLQKAGLRVDISEESWQGGPGSVLALVLDTRPVPTMFFALGERGKPAERVADEATREVVRYNRLETPAVDQHSADQLLLPLCRAEGPSTFPVAEVSSHLVTNAFVIRQFVDRKIEIEGSEGEPGIVRIG